MASLYGVTETERETRETRDGRAYRGSGNTRGEPSTAGNGSPAPYPGGLGSGTTAKRWSIGRDMQIGKRLLLGFGVLLLLLLVVALSGYQGSKRISDEMLNLLQTDAKQEQTYMSGLLKTLELRRDERDLFLGMGDERATRIAKEDWSTMLQRLRDDLETLQKLVKVPEEKDDVTSMQSALKDYEAQFHEMQAKLEAGKLKKSSDWVEADKGAKEARQFVEEHLRTAAAEHRSRMDDRVLSTQKMVRQTNLLLVGVLLLGGIAGAGISTGITRSITRPLGQAVGASQRILQGDLDVNVDVARRDELGQLMGIVKQIAGEFETKMNASARISSMVENAPINMMCTDLDLKLQYMNQASKNTLRQIEHILPIKVDQMLGHTIDIFHKNPEHQRKMLATDKHLPHEALIEVGTERMQLRVSAVYDQNRKYIGPMVTWELVTQKLKAEEEARQLDAKQKEAAANTLALNKVLAAVGNATNVNDAARAALQTVREAFGWEYGSYWGLDAKENALKFQVEAGSVNDEFRRVTIEARFHEGEGLSGRAWKNRDLFFVEDLADLKDCVRAPVARRAGVRSGIAFPLLADGKVVGTMDFFSLETLKLSEERLDALRGVGRVVSTGIARISGEEQKEHEQEALKQKVGSILEVVQSAAKGDLTREIAVRGSDAIGQMGEGLGDFLTNLRKSVSAIAQNSQSLASASEELSSVSQQMSANAEETSTQANVVSAASEQVNKNLQTVATATEEMSASIREIAKNATDAAKVANSAVGVAQKTNETVTKLGTSSAEIGEVIKVITSIAQQTNLLALNATIEAARAGEAGKGFAVVANEVKELAKETAKATDDISRKIESIQADTTEAVSAIATITEIITRINDISSTIASAVEEQNATTNEMTRNVGEAAKGSGEISKNIAGVADAAQSTSHGAGDSLKAADHLAKMSTELRELTSRFKY